MPSKVLVTGSSAGFGKLICKTLISRGHTVVASMRGVDKRNKDNAEELKAVGAHIVEIDVTSDKSVNEGVLKACDLAGSIDVVVNNAGVGVLGLQENFTPEDFQKVFEVNVFGVQRVNRAVLPRMRENRSGLLIHLSSLVGRIAFPFFGPYNASKWALEAMAENYRSELSAFGVDCCLVEPGGFVTGFMDVLIKPGDTSRDSSYGDLVKAPEGMMTGFLEAMAQSKDQDPQLVADAVTNLVDTAPGQRAFRTVVDTMGMGDPIKGYNEALEQITAAIFKNFGMEGMLTLNVPSVKAAA